MKVKQGHTIEKLIFDIQIPNEHLFKQIADLISGITEYELIQILESLLDKYSIQNQTISIAEIELDLGNISVADTRNQWITHFKMSLEKWLVEKFVGNNLPVDEQIKSFSLSERDFNLITYFITYGKIPWWGLNPPFIPDDTLKKYIREERIKTKDLIFTLGKIPTSRKRIIYQFKDDTLYQLFGILSPKPSSFFKDYATDLTEIHQKQKVVEEEDRAFKKVLQELILTYLISHTATSIDQTSFFKNQLLLLSKQYGISYKTLLDRIDEAIKTLPETYPQKFGIKSMVRELLQRDFRNVSLPKSSGNIGFSEYSELLTLFYTEKPHQITGKYHSKRERDRLIRVMIKRNKKKTFLILAEIHRKLKINKIQSAALFSESLLLEMMEIWQPSEVKLTVPLIDSFNFLHQNFFLFSGSNISVPGIIYSHFLAHSFTEKRSEVVPASRIIKSIAKSFNLNTEFLLKQLFSASKSDHPKLKNQIFQILNKEKQLILGAPADKIPDLPQLKNILAALLGTHFSLFEELIKKVSTLYPTLNSFVKQPAAYVLFIQNWMDEPKRSEHFPNFIHDLILLLSQRIPGDADDLQKSLLTQKSSISPKLFSVIQSAFKTKTQLSKQEARNLFSDPEYITKLDLPQLKNILAALLGTHFSLFEELIKKVSTLYPTLNSFVKQPTAYVLFIQNWMDEPKRSEHFPNFIHDLILLLSQRIPGEADDLQKSLLTQKSSYSPKLFSVIQSAFKTKTQLSKQEARNLFSDPEYITKLDLPQLKNILAALLDTHFSLFEELIKKVSSLYPTLNSFVKQPAFYLFLIDIIRVSPSNAYKMDLFFLKVISRLANKSKVPIKVFLSPFLVTKSVIPDKLINTLRVVYETVQEKYPTYTETVEMPVKAAESMGKLIEILGAEFFETISPSEHADKTSLFLEALVLDKNLVLEKLYDHKFNPNIPALLVYGLTDEALQLLQMSITGTFYHELIRASKDIMTWISRFNIIKLPRKKIGLWIKQQTLSYILLKESSPFQVDEYVQFILEKMQKERMLQLKELEKTLDQLSSPLQNEVKRLIIEKNKMPIPKARRDQQFFSDILIHYLITGKIQSWLSTPYLEIKELEYTFKQALTSENVALVKGILAIPMNLNIFNRLRALLGQNEPLILIQLIHKIFPERSLLSFYLSVTKMAIGLNISPDMSESVFRVFMQKKLWTINNQILRFELMRDGLNEQYKVDITLGEINIKGQAFSLSWFEYYVESGFWPEGFPEEQMNQYLDFLKLRILENPLLLLQITGKTSFHSFHQVILRRIFSVRELASIFKKIIPIKNISAPILTQIIEEYLAKGTKYLQKNNLDLVLDSILNLLLFERKEHSPVEQQLSQDLSGILPEIKPLGKSNAKYPVSTGTEKDFDLLDYYLTYGSLPIDYPYFDSKDWQSILENLKIKAPGTLQDQLYIWSKTPYKLNRLLELVSEEVAIALISMVNKALYEQITLLEKSVESVMGEKMRLKIGIRDEKALVRQILLLWGKNQKMQASPIPVLYRYFSLFLERKRLQPTLILALIVEKLKNVPSKQIHVLKSLQKYGRDTRTETVIKKEKPTTPEGMPQDAIYIANAGLVLLWPFLGRFFRRLNLVGTKEFIDEASLMRGILLTQYLVSGKKEAPEYELALNKLLCGAAMDLEIDSEIDITEEEINLSDSLLTGAITNWDKLKGTRINTFRETFLQRNGYLYYMNNRWELKVEKKAYDLLLETLPWGIQMIQMSWMKERLVVLWR